MCCILYVEVLTSGLPVLGLVMRLDRATDQIRKFVVDEPAAAQAHGDGAILVARCFARACSSSAPKGPPGAIFLQPHEVLASLEIRRVVCKTLAGNINTVFIRSRRERAF